MRGPLGSFRLWFQLIATGGFFVLLAWRVDIGEALRTLPEANWAWVLPGLVIYTASKAVHTLRWRSTLSPRRKSWAAWPPISMSSTRSNRFTRRA